MFYMMLKRCSEYCPKRNCLGRVVKLLGLPRIAVEGDIEYDNPAKLRSKTNSATRIKQYFLSISFRTLTLFIIICFLSSQKKMHLLKCQWKICFVHD